VVATATALRIGRYLADGLGVEATREAIAAVPVNRMLAALSSRPTFSRTPTPSAGGVDTVTSMLLWQPVIDGDLVPTHPLARIAAGAAADVDLLVASSVDDWRLFLAVSGAIE
jgi:para-nitrobenzyl esterase